MLIKEVLYVRHLKYKKGPSCIVYTFIGFEIPAMEKNFPILLTYTVVFIFILIVFSIVERVRKKA